MTPMDHRQTVDPSRSFSGWRVLLAAALGAAIGAAVSFLIRELIEHSPADIPQRSLRLFFLMVILAGALSSFAIEAMRQLQQQATDDVYRHPNPHRGRR